MSHGTFATVINCMDGRTQLPANEWATKTFNVDYIDTITEAGPDGILATPNHPLHQSILDRVKISVEKHGSKHVVLVAHYDCAGNPGDKAKHLKDLAASMETMKAWNLDAELIPIWIDEEWTVERINV